MLVVADYLEAARGGKTSQRVGTETLEIVGESE